MKSPMNQSLETYSQEAINILGLDSVRSSPDLGGLDCLQVETSDQAKVATTSLQSPEKIGVASLVCFNDGTIGKNNLVVHHSVTSESHLVAIKVHTSSKQQARNTNGTKTTTCSG